jgi:hypothetical protein
MLLLPLSFESAWTVRMHVNGHALQRSCTLHARAGHLLAVGDTQPAEYEASRWRVMLNARTDVPVDWLLGWRPDALQAEVMGAAAELKGPAGTVAGTEGTVVPMLHGAGLLVPCSDAHRLAEVAGQWT